MRNVRVRMQASVAALVIVGLGGGLVGAGTAAAQSRSASQERARPTQSVVSPRIATSEEGTELVDRRTARSRTYQTAGNNLTTKIFAEAVNYRDGAGPLRAIDNALVR